jgi:hypothetical protein
MDIRFEEREAYFAHRGIHICFREFAASAELIKYLIESVREVFKHKYSRVITMASARSHLAIEREIASPAARTDIKLNVGGHCSAEADGGQGTHRLRSTRRGEDTLL